MPFTWSARIACITSTTVSPGCVDSVSRATPQAAAMRSRAAGSSTRW